MTIYDPARQRLDDLTRLEVQAAYLGRIGRHPLRAALQRAIDAYREAPTTGGPDEAQVRREEGSPVHDDGPEEEAPAHSEGHQAQGLLTPADHAVTVHILDGAYPNGWRSGHEFTDAMTVVMATGLRQMTEALFRQG